MPRKSKDEFRYNYSTKHMNYVFEKENNSFHNLGITLKSKIKDDNKINQKICL